MLTILPLTVHCRSQHCAEPCLTFSTVTLANELRAQSLVVPHTGNTSHTTPRWLNVIRADWQHTTGGRPVSRLSRVSRVSSMSRVSGVSRVPVLSVSPELAVTELFCASENVSTSQHQTVHSPLSLLSIFITQLRVSSFWLTHISGSLLILQFFIAKSRFKAKEMLIGNSYHVFVAVNTPSLLQILIVRRMATCQR